MTITITTEANNTFTFTFTDRETYLAWRAEWRQTYRDLSKRIRDTKNAIKNAARGTGSVTHMDHYNLARDRLTAFFMLDERRASKLAAKAQREAARIAFAA